LNVKNLENSIKASNQIKTHNQYNEVVEPFIKVTKSTAKTNENTKTFIEFILVC
jgi:hypothetical protein